MERKFARVSPRIGLVGLFCCRNLRWRRSSNRPPTSSSARQRWKSGSFSRSKWRPRGPVLTFSVLPYGASLRRWLGMQTSPLSLILPSLKDTRNFLDCLVDCSKFSGFFRIPRLFPVSTKDVILMESGILWCSRRGGCRFRKCLSVNRVASIFKGRLGAFLPRAFSMRGLPPST